MLCAVWVWPALRAPRFWAGVALTTLVVAGVWLGYDLSTFETQQASSSQNTGSPNLWLRMLYVLLSETDRPVVQVTAGSILAALFSLRIGNSGNPVGDQVTGTSSKPPASK